MLRLNRRRFAALAGCLAAAALTSSASTALATYPGANGRIAYEFAWRSPPIHIHTVLPNGADDRDLGLGNAPAWSANGKRIAFVRSADGQTDIFAMDADGSNLKRVTRTPEQYESSPYFAPGGGRLVLTRAPFSKPPVIGSVRIDGSGFIPLALPGAGFQPTVSPDGRHIAYAASNYLGEDKGGIWVMRRDGSHKRRLIDGNFDRFPDYRPDGRRILFSQHSLPTVIRLDGSVAGYACGDFLPVAYSEAYSPDGSLLAYPHLFGQSQTDPDHFRGADIRTSDTALNHRPCESQAVTQYEQDPRHGFASNPRWQPLPNG